MSVILSWNNFSGSCGRNPHVVLPENIITKTAYQWNPNIENLWQIHPLISKGTNYDQRHIAIYVRTTLNVPRWSCKVGEVV